ncbi:MAG: flagellin [Spirochaetales bacterium]|jgi:flagellin|nr:flagellin [Spirochaetales bacterium]
MIINHNMSALFAHRSLKFNNIGVDKNMEKLSSGERINRAGDDASGLAVSEKMRAQVRGLKRAEQNAQDAISFIQTTEGYLTETTQILQRLRELSIQASNGIYSSEDRMQIQVEVSQLIDEVNRVSSHAQFNGMNILTGRFAAETGENVVAASMWFHIGANIDQRERVYIGTMTAQGLRLQGTDGLPHTATFISLSTPDNANISLATVDNALKTINKQRADLGAYQNRLEYAMEGLAIGAENLQAAESRIRDADMAKEMVEFVKNQILVQSATAMLAQANQKSQSVLQLFQ